MAVAVVVAVAMVAGGLPSAVAAPVSSQGSQGHAGAVRPLYSPPIARRPATLPGVGGAFSASAPRSGHAVGGPVAAVRSRWSATSRVFSNADGSLRVEVAAVPLNYRAASGWEPIDNTLKRAGRDLVTAGNSWTVRLGAWGDGSSVSTPEGTISIRPVGGDRSSAPAVASEPKVASTVSALAGEAAAGASVAQYKGAWPGVDVTETVKSTALVEDLVLRDRGVASSYGFEVGGATAFAGLDGGLGLSGAAGSRFGIAPLAVRDRSGRDVTAASGARLVVDRSGRGFSVVLDSRWLKAQSDSVFPVVVDPVLEWYWYGAPYCQQFGGACQQESVMSFSSSGGTWTNTSDPSEVQVGTSGGG